MKIGILTFHEIFNPGAYFQAMGTCQLVESLGHEPIIINYTSPSHRYTISRILTDYTLWRHPRAMVEMIGRHTAFQRAQVHFNRTKRLINHQDLEREEFDAVLIGADIVWDYVNPHLGNDPVYFGAHLNADKIISFAASCGKVSLEEVPPSYVVDGLKKMDHLYVRDVNTQAMVKKYAGRASEIICDPAFHLDIEPWMKSPKRKDDYLLVYASPQFLSDGLKERTIAYARKQQLKTVAVCYRQDWTDENRICIDPLEWMGYLKRAKAIVTNTFHGTIFSIKTGVPFVTELNDAIRLKTISMIEKLGIENHVYFNQSTLDDMLSVPCDLPRVQNLIQDWANEARQCLGSSLGD